MKQFKSITIAIIIIIFASGAAFGGVIARFKDGGVMMLEGGKLKQSNNDGALIINTNTEELIIINNENRSYIMGTVDEYCKSIQAAMDEMMRSIPPEQREMLKSMQGSGRNAENTRITVKKAGNGGTIAGYKTTKYIVYKNGKVFEELWLAKGTPMEKEVNQIDKIEKLTKKFENCSNTTSMPAEASPFDLSKEYQSLFKKGWVMKRIVHYDDPTMMGRGPSSEVEEIISIEKSP
ncbi:MAG: hypothetical protein D6726_09050, partial [Nitrospirae bacterium]